VFQLIRYGGKKGAPGGAFLNFEVNLELPEQLVGRIKARIPTLFGEWGMQATPDKLSLNVVQWDSGTVQCMALDLKGSGGTSQEDSSAAAVDDDGRIVFTEVIRGAAQPSLDGRNTAVFGLQLTPEGSQMLMAAFK